MLNVIGEGCATETAPASALAIANEGIAIIIRRILELPIPGKPEHLNIINLSSSNAVEETLTQLYKTSTEYIRNTDAEDAPCVCADLLLQFVGSFNYSITQSKRLVQKLHSLQVFDDNYYQHCDEILCASRYRPATKRLEEGLFFGPGEAGSPIKFRILISRTIGENRVDVQLRFTYK